MKNILFNLKYKIANEASNYPGIYTTISRALSGRDCYTSRNTDIVIDGYPRSANTYATYAFKVAQPKDLIIANHIHKKSQFILAEKYGIPAILLIRDPVDCISSLLIRQPKYNPATLFEGYFFLYNGLKHSSSYVVAPFNEVVTNYGRIIQQVNIKFNTNFTPYEKTTENEERVKQIVQTQDELKDATDYNLRVAYPNQERKKIKEGINSNLLGEKYKKNVRMCRKIFDTLLNKQT